MSIDPSELGYVFYPFPDGFSLGYTQLDIFLSDPGEAQGFVPREVVVCTWAPGVHAGENGMDRTIIAAHTRGEATHHVAPGFVTVQSHDGGDLEAYCFGGQLVYRAGGAVVVCRLTSPAPILNLSEEGLDWSENGILRVVDGLESDIASLRATFDAGGGVRTAQSFDVRLSRTDPRLLYAVALERAYRAFQALPEVLRTERYWDEYNVLARAIQEARLAAWWPAEPSLAAVLGQAP
jgi:hypothetical protein